MKRWRQMKTWTQVIAEPGYDPSPGSCPTSSILNEVLDYGLSIPGTDLLSCWCKICTKDDRDPRRAPAQRCHPAVSLSLPLVCSHFLSRFSYNGEERATLP